MSVFDNITGNETVIAGTHIATGGTASFTFIRNSTHQQERAWKPEPFSTIPFAPDSDFVDRPEIFDWICGKCAGPGARAALVGLGGIGKSQLAIRYAYHVRETSPQTFIFWVHAGTRVRFEQAYQDIAERLKLPGRDNAQTDVLNLVKHWLSNEAHGKWFMILDNADDKKTLCARQSAEDGTESPPLVDYLPQTCNGAILITSRNQDVAARIAGRNNIKEVQQMDEPQALRLFRNKLVDESNTPGAPRLLHALGYFPLAITQAVAYINRRGRLTASSYLEEFQRNDQKKEHFLSWDDGDLRRDNQAAHSVMVTWQMSYDRIRMERRSATDLLSLMGYFNPQGFPVSVLQRHRASQGVPGDAFEEDLDTLRAYSLLSPTGGTDEWEMHPLVQFCTRRWLSKSGESEQWKREFILLMNKEFPEGKFENWAQCRQLLPHFDSLYEMEISGDDLVREWAWVLDKAAWYTMEAHANYDSVERTMRRVLEQVEMELGARDGTRLNCLNTIASALSSQGKYEEAEEFHRRALKGREEALGPRNPDTLSSMNNLADVLHRQGKYEEAEELHRQALKGMEEALGPRHPDTLSSINNLANALGDQGKCEEAEALHRRALKGREEALGPWHPDTLSSMNNLANLLHRQGKYEEAEEFHRRALKGREEALGPRHPDTLSSMNNLANVLHRQGKYEEAEELHRRALKGREEALGPRHPGTLSSIHNLANVLHRQGKYEEAEEFHRRALKGMEEALGPRHPDTLSSINNLANALVDQEKYEEAEELHRRALKGREEVLGPRNPDTLSSINNLANVLGDQGKYEEAEELHRRALKGREEQLGPDRRNTLDSVFNLAVALHNQERYIEARELYQRAYDGYALMFGCDHAETLDCLGRLSSVRAEMNRDRVESNGAEPSSKKRNGLRSLVILWKMKLQQRHP